MTGIVPLLEEALEDRTAGLVLADLLEERGEDERARLVRRWAREERIVATELDWVGDALAKVIEDLSIEELSAVVLPYIVADVAEVVGPVEVGPVWRGRLYQQGLVIPTTMQFQERVHNRVRGTLDEEFGRVFVDPPRRGRFEFRGVAVGRQLAFVTHHVEGHGAWPGVYGMRLGGGGWASGEWWVPIWHQRGDLRLRRVAGQD